MSKVIKKTVFVGMSGGVDSSIATLLLKKRGFRVIGVHIRSWNVNGCDEKEAEDARRVAELLHIPFYVFNFEEEYKKLVVDYMIRGYKDGITPNPDVMCNREIKFGLFLKKALRMGADYVATGHYVQMRKKVTTGTEVYELSTAKDGNKDQSYFLWTLTQSQLRHSLFPIGSYLKSEIREIARRENIPTAEKKDSQGICFVGNITLQDFLSEYINEKPGPVCDIYGNVLGEHRGAYFYTIGQRHIGMKEIGGKSGKHDARPQYVVKKDIKKNTIFVGEKDSITIGINILELYGVNMINPLSVEKEGNCREVSVRIRYRQSLVSASLEYKNKDKCILYFKEPQMFVAPGQSAVFYDTKGRTMIGGGIIKE